jgi:predicted ATP-grasp superfamily ATP-dependent carboligase
LAIVQTLAHRGVPCWVCAPRRLQAAWSRFCRFRRLPDFHDRETDAVEGLVRLLREIGGRPIVFPAGDIEALALARHSERLGALAELCVSDHQTVELVLDKRRFYAWSGEQKLSCPVTVPLTGEAMPLDPPFVIKPENYSFLTADYLQCRQGSSPFGFKFRRIDDAAGWQDFLSRHRQRLDRFVAQELIQGADDDRYSVGIYSDRGARVRAVFVGRVLRCYPPFFGNTVLGQNDCVPDAVLEEVTGIVKRLGLSGIAEFEYRRDSSTGRHRLLEINPRSWSWMQASMSSNADVAWTAYRDLCGIDVAPVEIANTDPGRIKAVRAMADAANVLFRYPKGHRHRWIPAGTRRKSLAAQHLISIETHRSDWPLTLFCLLLLGRDILKNEG